MYMYNMSFDRFYLSVAGASPKAATTLFLLQQSCMIAIGSHIIEVSHTVKCNRFAWCVHGVCVCVCLYSILFSGIRISTHFFSRRKNLPIHSVFLYKSRAYNIVELFFFIVLSWTTLSSGSIMEHAMQG